MNSESSSGRSAFAWNAGGWFGAQLGATLWMVILGFVLLRQDTLAASVCVGSFLALNEWGFYLWRRRERLSAYVGLQRLLLAASVVTAGIVVLVNSRGLSEPPASGAMVSTYLPYWAVAAGPALMLFFYFMERRARRGRA